MRRERGPSAFAVGVGADRLRDRRDVPRRSRRTSRSSTSPTRSRPPSATRAGINAGSPVRIAGVEVGKVTQRRAHAARRAVGDADAGDPRQGPAGLRRRDGEDPAADLPRGQLLRRARRPARARAGELDDGETIPVDRTGSPVQFDQVLSALKSDTRNDLRQIFAEVGKAQDAGGAKAFNDSLRYQPARLQVHRRSSPRRCSASAPATSATASATSGAAAGGDHTSPRRLRDAHRRLQHDRRRARRPRGRADDRRRRAAAHAARRDAGARRAQRRVPRRAAASRATRGPGVRSLGPTVDATLPLVKQLRGLVQRVRAARRSRATCAARRRRWRRSRRPASRVLGRLRELSSCANERARPVRRRQARGQGVPDARAGLPGPREVPARPRRREPLVRRQRPVVQGPGRGRRRDAEPRQRALRHGRRADRRQQPAADPPAPAAAARRAVRDAAAARPALDPARARRRPSTRAAPPRARARPRRRPSRSRSCAAS